jgi:hypothetical protein
VGCREHGSAGAKVGTDTDAAANGTVIVTAEGKIPAFRGTICVGAVREIPRFKSLYSSSTPRFGDARQILAARDGRTDSARP